MSTNFNPAASGRAVMAAAVVLGSSLTAPAAVAPVPAAATSDTISDISRYCQACWRNARLPQDHWPDCTQQVFVRLLERVQPAAWGNALSAEGEERKELFRAIDAVKKRTQRAKVGTVLPMDVPAAKPDAEAEARREAVAAAAAVLSGRQQQILTLSADGWDVSGIAGELGTTPERVSDEKYKAVRKLKAALGLA